ncbi:retrovirus-related pol polyprotein from transposon TNT 1-94 [Tanacetum coccineum]
MTRGRLFVIAHDVPEIFMQQFWTILDIFPRVEGVDFTDVPDNDIALTFLIDLGYKGPLYKHTNIFVDHMHHPWRTLAAIINKCLLTNLENPELTYYRGCSKEKMLTIRRFGNKQSGIISNVHQVFYWSNWPKKSRGKGSQGKKTADDSQETVDVSEEYRPLNLKQQIKDSSNREESKETKLKLKKQKQLKTSPLATAAEDARNQLTDMSLNRPNKKSGDKAKADVKKDGAKAKDDPKKTELPHQALAYLRRQCSFVGNPVLKLSKRPQSSIPLVILKSQVPSVVDNYLGSKFSESSKKQTPTVDLEQGSEKSASEILQIKREQAEKQQKPKFTINSTNKAALEEYDLKRALYQSMHASKSFNRNPTKHQFYHAPMEALIEYESVMDKGVTETDKDHKRKHDDDEDDDDEDPPTGPNQCKAPSKGSKTGKSSLAKEPVEEPIAKVVMDDAGDDVAHEDNQPQDASKPKTAKTSNQDWFKQPPRPPTPDPEWNKRQTYFFNNDLEYLKTSDPEVTYTSFIKKTKVALYEIKGIEDMVPTLWSTIKHAIEQRIRKGIKHGVKGVKFLVPDHQLGVESYQKKLNITNQNLMNTFPEIELQRTLRHGWGRIIGCVRQEIVYERPKQTEKSMRADELYKFSDGTLKSVRDEIHHKVLDFLDYNTEMPKRKWTVLTRKKIGLIDELNDTSCRKRNHQNTRTIELSRNYRDGIQTYDARHGPSDAMHNPSQPLKTLSRSSAEAEYRGVANAVAETCWLRNLLRELHTPLSSATLVHCDNVSVVYLSCNPVQHQRTKHIEIDIHFVRDLVVVGQVRVLHVPSRYQFADIFTKGLPSGLFEEFRSSLSSTRCSPASTAEEC